MKKMGLWLQGLISAVLATIYVSLVALLMSNGESIFGKEDGFLVPFFMLLLFVLSAAVMGSLIFGRPVMMYIDGKKKEAVKLLGGTVGWIFAIVVIMLIIKVVVS